MEENKKKKRRKGGKGEKKEDRKKKIRDKTRYEREKTEHIALPAH